MEDGVFSTQPNAAPWRNPPPYARFHNTGPTDTTRVRRHDRLGDLLHEYQQARIT